ncbi:MAG: hypothetical protein LBD11_03695 [Candidatus Peribacteria bacterium]|nr:hypothetical protein [Candidatus Peribacteria bacterium]
MEEIMKVFNITKSIDKIEFHKFYHDLVDISKTTIDLPRGISLQVKKTVKDLNISPLDLYDKNTSLHTLPISYELNTDDFDQFEIADRVAIQKFLETSFGVDNKTVTVDGDKIGRLIYLFFLDKNTDTTAITALSPQNEKSLKEIFDQAIDIEHPILEGIETVNLTPKEKFIEERNKVKGYPFTDEDCGFRPGTRLVAAI